MYTRLNSAEKNFLMMENLYMKLNAPNFKSMIFFAKSYKKYVCLFFAQKIVSINMSESSLNVRAKKT